MIRMIKTYLTVIINICGIGLCPKINFHNNTKSARSNKANKTSSDCKLRALNNIYLN